MRSRLLLPLAIVLLLCGSPPSIAAQEFAPPAGLVQAVIRVWMGPTAVSSRETITEINLQGTPVGTPIVISESTPIGQTFDPDTAQGTVLLSATIMEFESPASASDAFADYTSFMTATLAQAAPFAGSSVEPLTSPGDQGSLLVAQNDSSAVPQTFVAAAVQSDTYLYLLQGTFARLDPAAEAVRLLTPVVETPVGSTLAQVDPAGASTGGIWDKLASVDPVLVVGSTVTDAVIVAPPLP